MTNTGISRMFSSLKAAVVFFVCALLSLSGYSQIKCEWAFNPADASAIGGTVAGTGVKADATGSTYTTGYFQATADFNPGAGISNLTSSGSDDVYFAKYDASGNYVFAKSFGGASADVANSITVDGSGNIYLAGYFQATSDFDPGTAVNNMTSAGSSDIFFAKFDASGNFIFAKRLGGTGDEQARSVAVDASGNIYVSGYFQGTADFDPGAGTVNLISAGAYDIFFAKYDATGNLIYAKAVGGTADDQSYSVSVDGLGYAYISGSFTGTADFDPGAGAANLVSAGGVDIYFAGYDAMGNYIYAKGIGSTGDDRSYGSGADVAGNIYVTGYFSNTADFDPGAGTVNLVSAGLADIFYSKYDAAGNYIYAFGMGTANNESGMTIVNDAAGNVFIAGYYAGTLDFDPGAGIANRTGTGGTESFLAGYNASGNFVFAKSMGGTSTDVIMSVANDASGNLHVAGYFQGTSDYDPDAGVANIISGSGLANAVTGKYNSTGAYIWAGVIGGYSNTSSNQAGSYLITDNAGNTYVTGYFAGTVDFDPGPGTLNLTSGGGDDIFLAKYDANGNCIFANRMGGTSSEQGAGLALDAGGNIYITGLFNGTVDFDPGAGIANLVCGGGADIFFAKYNASGSYVYAKGLPGANIDMGISIAADVSGNAFVTGYFWGTVDFDPGAGSATMSSSGGTDMFVGKYDASGNYVFAKKFGSGSNDYGVNVLTDATGNLYMLGMFQGTIDFDPGAGVVNLTSAGGLDGVFAKYDNSMNYIFAKKIGGASNESLNSIKIDADGNIFLTGSFMGTADFDPGAGVVNLISAGAEDVYIAKYDASGNYLYAKGMGGTSADIGNSLVIDADGNTVIAGYFSGTGDFDPGAPVVNLVSAGSNDIFLAKFDAGGNYTYAKNFGGTGDDRPTALSMDASKCIYLTGSFYNTVDFEPGITVKNLTSLNSMDMFLAKFGSPEINLQGNTVSIVDGDVSSSLADHTEFGSQNICTGTITRTYTIQNTGNASLIISAVTLSGTNAADFSLSGITLPASVAAGSSSTFQIAFDPPAVGLRTATVTVNSDDEDEAVYDFAIQGTGTDPEINVQGNAQSISDGDATPSATDHTDFGSQSICSGTIVRTFTILNTGTSDLVISGVTLSGSHVANYSITAMPASTVAPAASTTFQVTFNPSSSGGAFATVNITSDDCDETVYNFAIQGWGIDPEINVQGNSVTIADGDLTPTTADYSDFGSVLACTGTIVRTYTIQNTGSFALSVSGVTVTGTHAADFTVTATPSFTVAAAGSTTFQITFNPSATGLRSAIVNITNDDCNESTYNFAIQGTGNSDIVDPTALCKNISVDLDGTGSATITAAMLDNGSTDNCGVSSISINQSSFSCANFGPNAITLTVTDGSGNSSTCISTVTVNDVILPSITCAGPQSFSTDAGVCTVSAPALTLPSVSDNCSSVTGNALNFDGVNDYISVPAPAISSYTIETWVKFDGPVASKSIICYTDGSGPMTSFSHQIKTTADGRLIHYTYDGSMRAIYGNTVLVPGQWYHVAIVAQPNTAMRLYVNGVEDCLPNLSLGTPWSGGVTFRIGQASSGGDYFNGTMDEVRIWNVARTASEISTNMNCELGPQAGLVAVYHLNQGIADGNNAGVTSVKDHSGNNYNGTLYNSALTGAASNWTGGKSQSITITNNAPALFPLGTTNVTWKAVDPHGNSATCSQNVIVTDNQSPIAVTVSDVTGECSVTPLVPSTADNCAGTIGGTTLSVFPITAQGTTVVTWTFSDGNGNSITADQNVIIYDVTKPTFTCPADKNLCAGYSSLNITPTNVLDNCSGSVNVSYKLSGATTGNGSNDASSVSFNSGTTIVKYIFDDGNGNKDSCSFNVNVYPVYSFSETHSICSGETYSWHGQNLTSSGTYNDNLISVHGCDSVYTLNLTVNELPYNTDVTTGLKAYYPFNGNANDESGNSNNGTVNGPVLTSGNDALVSTAYSFDGVDDMILIADPVPASLQIQNEITLSAWIYVTQYPGSSNLGLIVGSQCDACSAKGASIFLDGRTNSDGQPSPPGHIHFQIGDGSWHQSNTQTAVPLNQWVHIVATRKANENAKVYYNGVSQPLTSTAWSGSVSYSGAYFAIGRQRDYSNRFFKGKIDEVRVYNRAISQYEVNALYQDMTAYASADTICVNSSTDINLLHSQNGVSYQMQKDGTDSGAPQTGNGNTLVFSTGNLTSNAVFTFTATNTTTSCSRILSDVNAITVTPVYSFSETHSICNGETYTWHGQDLTSAGTYYDNKTTINGCDSIYTLNLTVNPVYAFSEFHSICDGETYMWHGQSLTATGTYYDNQTTVLGCDSIYTLALTVNPVYTFNETHSICDGETYVWHGQDLTAPGTYYDNQTTVNGCDSTYSLDLTVNPVYAFSETYSICNGQTYTWHGQDLTTAGTYYDNQITVAGCDSIYTLDLTVNPVYSYSETHTICSNETYIWHGQNLNASGIYYDNQTSVSGCDSIYTLDLTVNTAYDFSETQSICPGSSVVWHGQTLSAPGIYYDSLVTVTGCDSVYAINITENPVYLFNQTDSICTGDTIVWQGAEYFSSGTFTATYYTVNGCDSVYTLDLTVLSGSTFSQNIYLCDGETYTIGSHTYSSWGVYTDTLVAANSCDSIVTTGLYYNIVDVSTSLNSNTITAEEGGGTYQWLDCNNGYAEIPGETSQTYTALVDGNYAVIVTVAGCSDTSACVPVIVIGVPSSATVPDLKVIPNPSDGRFVVVTKNYDEIEIYTLHGSLVYDSKISADRNEFSLELAQGVYLLKALNGDQVRYVRLVIQK